jgi:hypothetical protein
MADGYRNECKDCLRIKARNNHKYEKKGRKILTKEQKKEYRKKWYEENKEKVIEQSRINKIKYRKDPIYKVKDNINRRIRKKIKGFHPDMVNIIKHIEMNFTDDINWNNYGTVWHIDHIIPQAVYDFSLKEDIDKCWDKRNLRPMLKEENLMKHDKLEIQLVKEYGIEDLMPASMEVQYAIG